MSVVCAVQVIISAIGHREQERISGLMASCSEEAAVACVAIHRPIVLRLAAELV